MKKATEHVPAVVDSDLSRFFEHDGHIVDVRIYCLEDSPNEWSLEVVDKDGTSTVWDEIFLTDEAAWAEFEKTIEVEGIASMVGSPVPAVKS